jgi:sugar transferase (PEP-CTERM/EpsH1 system associated)
MEELLFLAHRIPYPPNKGDKIRSYHILRHLSRRYRVHLGAFIDDTDDLQYASTVGELCAQTCLVPLNPRLARVRSLTALLRGDPLSLAYFGDRRLHRWVRSILARDGLRRLFVYSSPMAQYILPSLPRAGTRSLLDFVDVDSDKWAQYAASKPWPMSALYRREGRTLEHFERKAAAAFDASVLVSQSEAEMFRRIAPESAEKIGFVENGVDTEFFSPDRDYPDPFDGNDSVLVFTGAMDYWANVDAVSWFANEAFPLVRRQLPDARFFVVGSRPTREVQQLATADGSVMVTGRVDDVRPFLHHALAAVAPLRIARGIQNKVLEALAMARPVVASPQALEGLEFDSPYPLEATSAEDWGRLAAELSTGSTADDIGNRFRLWVAKRYAWDSRLEQCINLLED